MKTLLATLAILVLSLAAYSNSFNAEFHFDDFHQLVKNQNVRDLSNIPRFFTDAGLGSTHLSNRGYRPVTLSSFALNYASSGYRVFGYHLLNFILHFLNAFLVFVVVKMVLKASGRDDPYRVSLFAALAFALHPLQTSAVTYVSSRAALLAAFFWLLALAGFIKFRTGGQGRGRHAWAALAPSFFLLGFLSKEIAVSLLGVLFAYDLIFTVPVRGGLKKSLGALLAYIPFLAVLLAYLGVRKVLQGAETVYGKYAVGDYLMSESKALLMYLRLLFLPVNQNVDYDLPLTTSVDARVFISALLVCAMLYIIYRLRKKSPAAAFFGSWFFIALLPESSFIPIIDIAVEYRLYLPSAGFIAAIAVLADGVLKAPSLRRGFAVAVLAVFGVLAFYRNSVWATEYTLWSDAVKKSPYSARVHTSMGNALMVEKRYADAVEELKLALEVDPSSTVRRYVYNNLGGCLANMGRTNEAIYYFRQAVMEAPDFMEPYENQGKLYLSMGRYREAEEILRTALSINPGFSQLHYYLARVYIVQCRNMDAIKEYEEAVKYSPMDFDARYQLAASYYDNGMREQALRQANIALDLAVDGTQRKNVEWFLSRLEGGRQR